MKGESNGDWREREMDRNSVIESIILVDFFFFFFEDESWTNLDEDED